MEVEAAILDNSHNKKTIFIIGLNNWVYNICRYTQLKKIRDSIGYLCPKPGKMKYLERKKKNYGYRKNTKNKNFQF